MDWMDERVLMNKLKEFEERISQLEDVISENIVAAGRRCCCEEIPF